MTFPRLYTTTLVIETSIGVLVLLLMLSPPNSVGKGTMFSGCLVGLYVCSSGQILLPRYLMNSLNNFHKTDRE